MRTTIEISDNIHLRLIEEAALTGQRGFSTIVEKAIRQYFRYKGISSTRKSAIQNLYGSILEEDIDDQVSIRRNWRTGRNFSEDMSENNS
ncbi:MAG: hypothetical protein J7L71_05270 [Spirochaetaceae bacterium]|nr:hypothetical protein [Spirochaetaceae bacterium]